ncbi:predicted protein [Postia placenta Mad-698-R]|nr:predicted protein [Postia placenta Mad-698-R]
MASTSFWGRRWCKSYAAAPVESKASPMLPPHVSSPTVQLTRSDRLQVCLRDIVAHILTIPLLHSRLPFQSLTLPSARLPISSFNLLSSSTSDIVDSSPLSAVEPKIHLLANLVMFTPPRYAKLPATALDTYLQLTAMLMNALPTLQHHPSRLSFIAFCFALTTVWLAKRDKVLGTFTIGTGRTVRDGDNSSPLRGWVARAARNPLTLDELVVFSRKLLNIAFVLYWRKDPSSVQQDDVPGLRAVK